MIYNVLVARIFRYPTLIRHSLEPAFGHNVRESCLLRLFAVNSFLVSYWLSLYVRMLRELKMDAFVIGESFCLAPVWQDQ
jgi:hypothetical protein